MLFNSYEFIFVFLPATLAVFLLLGRASRSLALSWLIVASLVFYAWWRPFNVAIIVPSILSDFVLAKILLRCDTEKRRFDVASKIVLAIGIAANLGFLGYFKYASFVQSALNDIVGTQLVLTEIILPLGISFITFQKIAFLIDIRAGRIGSFSFWEFCLFILFFPQLIAGPIVHFRETVPQFRTTSCRYDPTSMSIGVTLFLFGLFKKVVLADGIAPYVTSVYDLAESGVTISLFPAWLAAIGFSLQIYFDFSGYSDMAIGLARCFGIRLPINFASPLKASSIIDFWLRWHVTLTRFLTAYLYTPIALWLTRKRLARGLPGLSAQNTSVGAFLLLLAFPTVFTMFLSGLWHGAGYLFILWGVLHGCYLTINHVWRLVGPRLWSSTDNYSRFMRPTGFVFTFLSVAVAMILFRSTTTGAAVELLKGAFGLNGISLPQQIIERVGLTGVLQSDPASATEFVLANLWMLLLLSIALILPNTLQLMGRYQPALGFAEGQEESMGNPFVAMEWSPSLVWAVGVSALGATAILRLGGASEFLYWQF